MLYRKWQTKQLNISEVQQLSDSLGISTVLAKVLLSKGAKTQQEAQDLFLKDTPLSDPFLLKDMDKAVERIHKAIKLGEKVVVYGDYDADGVCATATLFSYLESVGSDVFYKLPNRETDGYGLNSNVLKKLKSKGVDLVITVDNGISAIQEIELANSLGLEVIVTDHHLPKSTVPPAFAVVDPLQKDDKSPCKTLSGVGVAFKLICALEGAPCCEMLEYYSDLVAVGTVADLMLLEGENRTIVKSGLTLLNEGMRQGFNSLIMACGMKGKELTSESIAYTIGPRINAAGRMGDATMALELLLCDDAEEGLVLANELEGENQKRQETQNKMAEDITQEILSDQSLIKDRVIVVWAENFHPGVVGIVASRLVERYAKPAIVLTRDGEEYKGSGRSVPAFNLHAALEKTKHLLTRFGGHELAAGLTIEEKNLEAFRAAINEVANNHEALAQTESLFIDCQVELDEIDENSVAQISLLAPFGNGNQNPLFMMKEVQLVQIYPVSDGKHIRLKVKNSKGSLQGIMFNVSPQEFAYKTGDILDVCANLSIYQGDSGNMVSVRIKEVRPSGMPDEIIDCYDVYKLFKNNFEMEPQQKQMLCPTRTEVAEIYRCINSQMVSCDDLRPLFLKFREIPSGKIQVIVDILIELGLVESCQEIRQNYFKTVKVKEKRDLSTSEILQQLQQE
ncbi:MAG: single-stranded-DNA-specific exonuclease RecJ [Oscillospiraceae bacterium]